MFKSIFVKLLTSFGFIILVSFFLLVSIITSIVNGYSLSQNKDTVKWTANTIKTVIEESIDISEEKTLGDFIVGATDMLMYRIKDSYENKSSENGL